MNHNRQERERKTAEEFAEKLVSEWWKFLQLVPLQRGTQIVLHIEPGHEKGRIQWPNPETPVVTE